MPARSLSESQICARQTKIKVLWKHLQGGGGEAADRAPGSKVVKGGYHGPTQDVPERVNPTLWKTAKKETPAGP